MKIRQVKSIATVLYMLGFVSSIITMFVCQMMGSNNLHMIEHCLAVFIVGAVTLCICDLYDLWRGEE